MKLHHTAVDRLLKTYDVWGGYREDTKLKKQLDKLEFVVYTRQDGTQVLVFADDYDKATVGQ